MRVAADQAISAWRSRPPDLDGAAQAVLAERVGRALTTVRDGYEQSLRAYAGSLSGLRPAFAEVAATDAAWQQTAATGGGAVPPPGTDPRAVAAWWQGLSQTERDSLLATRFDELGRLGCAISSQLCHVALLPRPCKRRPQPRAPVVAAWQRPPCVTSRLDECLCLVSAACRRARALAGCVPPASVRRRPPREFDATCARCVAGAR